MRNYTAIGAVTALLCALLALLHGASKGVTIAQKSITQVPVVMYKSCTPTEATSCAAASLWRSVPNAYASTRTLASCPAPLQLSLRHLLRAATLTPVKHYPLACMAYQPRDTCQVTEALLPYHQNAAHSSSIAAQDAYTLQPVISNNDTIVTVFWVMPNSSMSRTITMPFLQSSTIIAQGISLVGEPTFDVVHHELVHWSTYEYVSHNNRMMSVNQQLTAMAATAWQYYSVRWTDSGVHVPYWMLLLLAIWAGLLRRSHQAPSNLAETVELPSIASPATDTVEDVTEQQAGASQTAGPDHMAACCVLITLLYTVLGNIRAQMNLLQQNKNDSSKCTESKHVQTPHPASNDRSALEQLLEDVFKARAAESRFKGLLEYAEKQLVASKANIVRLTEACQYKDEFLRQVQKTSRGHRCEAASLKQEVSQLQKQLAREKEDNMKKGDVIKYLQERKTEDSDCSPPITPIAIAPIKICC